MVAGALREAGGGHGAFAVPAGDHGAFRCFPGMAGEVAEFDVDRAGDVPGDVLGTLPDIEDRAVGDAVGGE